MFTQTYSALGPGKLPRLFRLIAFLPTKHLAVVKEARKNPCSRIA